MLQLIDRFLNQITMYRLVLYGLLLLVFNALLLALFNFLPFTAGQLFFSLLVLLGFSYLFNQLFAGLFKAVVNSESAAITALILTLISSPLSRVGDVWLLLLLAFLAMASKYLLAIKKKHLFNPAAAAALLFSLLGLGLVNWWVATPLMLPVVTVLGLLVVRKIRRFPLLWSFLLASLLSITWHNRLMLGSGLQLTELWWEVLRSWPLVFFATIMLTEPLTMPPRKRSQILYGLVVGFLFGSNFHWGPFYSTPQLALLVGNLLAYFVSSKQKLTLHLKEKILHGQDIYELVFQPDQPLQFQAGQYLEWTLGMHKTDSRGNRRYFTVASAPTQADLRLVVKITAPASQFKQTLLNMQKGEQLVAANLAGDFVLPADKKEKLVWIAGGIGVTPFLSMTRFLLDQKEKREVHFFYAGSQVTDFIHQDLWSQAEQELGFKTHYVLTQKQAAPKNWQGYVGYLTAEILQRELGKDNNYRYYLSGPNQMVDAYKALLLKMGVKSRQIMTDYFPGF